jgi:plastocyanin
MFGFGKSRDSSVRFAVGAGKSTFVALETEGDSMRKLIIVVAAMLALAVPAGSFAATTTVKILGTAFAPKSLTVESGDTVKWVNADNASHQIVADNGTFASPTLTQNESYSFTFKVAGTFAYHDALRPATKGTITVKGPPPSITLGAGAPILVYGDETTLTGTVSSGQANEAVVITGQPYGALIVQQVATVQTGIGGGFAFTVQPSILTTFTAHWKTASSETVTVQVRPKVTLSRSAHGKLYAKVIAPVSYAGKFIYLQRLSSFGQWVTVRTLNLGPLSGRIFTPPRVRGTYVYRVYMSQNTAGAGYLDGWSGTQKVRHR